MKEVYEVRYIAIAIILMFLCISAYAHKPIAIDGRPSSYDQPYEIDDITVSQVAYHNATKDKLEIWMKFSAREKDILRIQLGSPKLKDKPVYYPAVAIIGRNLPKTTLPFSIPNELGAVVFTTTGQTPKVFHEEFTGTDSWMFEKITFEIPESGDYFLVGFLPEPREGKFWVALGEKEKFSFWDIVSLPWTVIKVRNFHEVFPFGGLGFWGWIFALIIIILLIGAFLFTFVL